MGATKKLWSVYVEGNEINDYYLTRKRAESLAFQYFNDGYSHIHVMKTR